MRACGAVRCTPARGKASRDGRTSSSRRGGGNQVPYGGKNMRVTLIHDLTAQHEAERGRREHELRLRMLTTQVPAILWTTDEELTLTSISGSALADFGTSESELIGNSLHGTL